METANTYFKRQDAINYNVRKLTDGWKIEISVPKNVSSQDRAKVIDWIHSYRQTVREQNPTWLSTFRVEGAGYSLEIKPAQNFRKVLESGEQTREFWGETLKSYAQR